MIATAFIKVWHCYDAERNEILFGYMLLFDFDPKTWPPFVKHFTKYHIIINVEIELSKHKI